MKILIVGLGSIGKRHARILKEMGGHELFALRTLGAPDKTVIASEAHKPDIHELHSWDEADRFAFDAALITNPTFLHIETALQCARRNMHLCIEKPIDSKIDRLDELIELVNQKGLTAYVAYPLRFHPVMGELKKRLQGKKILHSRAVSASYLPNWRSKQNHKTNYSTLREQGGGVLLDLSHEIDYIEYLFGEIEDIQGIFGRRSEVTVDSEDFCDLNLFHPNGVTNLHMNLFSRKTQRLIEVDTEAFYVKGDLNNFQMTVKEGGDESLFNFPADEDAMFRSQMRYFLDHLGRPDIQNNLERAGKLFRKILQFRNGKEYSCHGLR